jgi:hypothetical protein
LSGTSGCIGAEELPESEGTTRKTVHLQRSPPITTSKDERAAAGPASGAFLFPQTRGGSFNPGPRTSRERSPFPARPNAPPSLHHATLGWARRPTHSVLACVPQVAEGRGRPTPVVQPPWSERQARPSLLLCIPCFSRFHRAGWIQTPNKLLVDGYSSTCTGSSRPFSAGRAYNQLVERKHLPHPPGGYPRLPEGMISTRRPYWTSACPSARRFRAILDTLAWPS